MLACHEIIDVNDVITIPANQQELTIPINPIDDENPEPTIQLTYRFTTAGYESADAAFALTDDEPPLFQNPVDQFDLDGNGETNSRAGW